MLEVSFLAPESVEHACPGLRDVLQSSSSGDSAFWGRNMGADAVGNEDAVGLPRKICVLDLRVHAPRRDLRTGVWTYPSSALVREEVGLHTIEHYMQVRRQHIAAYIVNWPIFDFCREGERKQGTSPRLWCWEQPMDLDLARGEASASEAATPGTTDDGD